ncbi:PAB-dependent poly(A)-specific ribonuclease subunit PAN3 [Leucoagaricus sp. SymC.cos]|nr:PAB-dependent poly(A)-specific ribonuclease subunit PAN3 [Leucoagaricus sp. SymC.cos]
MSASVASPPTSPQSVYEPESWDHYVYVQADDVAPVDNLVSNDAGYYDDAQYSYVPPCDPTTMDAWYTNPATFHRQPLDVGSEERVMLVSRDDASCLVISYKEIKACMEGAFR